MIKKQKVTLIEVAELAGVSRAAAGKVLNGGSDKIGVGAAARKRILEAARQLNYQPNMAASILAGGSSKLIGVFLDSFASYRTLRLLQEIQRVCVEQGYRIMTSFSHDDIVSMREDYFMLQRYGVRGFICCAHDYPDLKNEVAELFADAKNVVFMEKPCLDGMPYVRTSRVKALTEMIGDALKQGCRKIGMMHASHLWLSERMLLSEFEQAMRANRMEPDPKLIFEYTDESADSCSRIRQAMARMILPCRPDFLFIDDAVHSVALCNCLVNAGLNLTIHGGNDDPLFKCLDIRSFDPQYELIASELLKLLLNPETRTDVPVVESIYRKG